MTLITKNAAGVFLLLASSFPTTTLAQNDACPNDILNCPDGVTVVGRNPNNNCDFFPCVVACPQDSFECPDGTSVGRIAPFCEFQVCPGGGACTTDVFQCPDASFVGRIPPDCDFATCPVACTTEVQECPDGTFVGRQAPDCEFTPCPVACSLDTLACDDGTIVGRVPPNCDFEECSTVVVCPFDSLTCPDGTVVGRVPPECLFEDCPADVCTQDGLQCPDGSFVGRIPPDCEFADCPPVVCGLDVFVCPDSGEELVRDPANNCEFPDCPAAACPLDIFTCEDGTTLTRDPANDCNFPDCPAVACPLDVLTCPNGDELVRDPDNNCEFPDCVDVCPLDIFTCPNGEELVRDPANNCDFPECSNICTTDVLECDDGSFVDRVPPECEFAACPPVACTADVFECPDGSFVGRAPPECAFEPCPDVVACTLDVEECPDGSFVSRIPPNCNFAACPPPPTGDYFALQAATGGCIGRRETGSDELVFSECNTENDFVLWRMDEEGRFHSKTADNLCIQADRFPELLAGTDGLDRGTSLYAKECNENLKLPFQTFDQTWDMNGAPLTLASRPDLCVVHFGAQPVIGESRIMLIECDALTAERAEGWMAVYPAFRYFTLSAADGGCLARKNDGSDELFLKACSTTDENSQWRLDSTGRFRSKVDDECMQAAEYPTLLIGPEALKTGTRMYVKSCEGPLKLTYQAMTSAEVWSVDGVSFTGPVALDSRPDLCVVHFGADPVVGESRIMLKDCASLGGGRALGWTSNPV